MTVLRLGRPAAETACQSVTLTLRPAATCGGVSTTCRSSEEPPRFRSITGARTVLCFVLWL